jgi:hypothetical protein
MIARRPSASTLTTRRSGATDRSRAVRSSVEL